MKSHFFAYISRMRFIQRWALMRNTAPENVQEHSHQVAVLAHALAVLRNEKFGGHVDPGAVAVAALYHDASEILTGDMPTPIKYDNPAIRKAYKDVEAVAESRLVHMLPPGRGAPWLAAALCLFFSRFGFTALVERGYPVLGALCAALLVLLCVPVQAASG